MSPDMRILKHRTIVLKMETLACPFEITTHLKESSATYVSKYEDSQTET